jgi:hypothetical protein
VANAYDFIGTDFSATGIGHETLGFKRACTISALDLLMTHCESTATQFVQFDWYY